MHLFEAIMKAIHERRFMVHRMAFPSLHFSTHTEFTPEDRNATDWQVSRI